MECFYASWKSNNISNCSRCISARCALDSKYRTFSHVTRIISNKSICHFNTIFSSTSFSFPLEQSVNRCQIVFNVIAEIFQCYSISYIYYFIFIYVYLPYYPFAMNTSPCDRLFCMWAMHLGPDWLLYILAVRRNVEIHVYLFEMKWREIETIWINIFDIIERIS